MIGTKSGYRVGEHPFVEEKPDPTVGSGERKVGDDKIIDEATREWAESGGMNTPDKNTKD